MRHIMDIYCKVAIITGGTSGIGYAAAHILLNNGAKCVVLSGRSRERGRRAAQDLGKIFGKDKVLYMQGDVNDEHHF
ncbi:unnamed protein product, partial [Timema podura]|nr:unnamed protein product [Timema podura]